MTSLLRHKKVLWIWSLVPIVVLAELVQQWRIPRQEPSETDWRSAAAAVAKEKGPDDLVIIAPDWAVQGRMYFKELMHWKDFGRLDTTTYRRIFEVSMMDSAATETKFLTAAQTETYGKLTVKRYDRPNPDRVIYDFTEHLKQASLSRRVQKNPSIVIDHWFVPRRAISMKLHEKAVLTFKDVPLDGVLRGYAFIGYFEARFDKGSPVSISIFVDGKQVGEELVANFDPLRPFEYPLHGTGSGTVRFEVSAPDNPKRELGLAVDVRIPGGDR